MTFELSQSKTKCIFLMLNDMRWCEEGLREGGVVDSSC